MHGQVNHAPVTKPRRILEVGCGTGSTTAYFAEKYSTAEEVIGVDLSAVPEQADLSRATFLQGDFHTLAGNSPLHPDSFDYIFSRMLVFGMTDWPGYLAQARDLLKTGGWLELQEMDFYFFGGDQQLICEEWKWLHDQTAAWTNRGLDIRIGPKLEDYLHQAGFVDVHAKEYRWVWGRWRGHPETDMIGDYSPKYLIPVNVVAYKKVIGPTKTAAELEKDEADMKENLKFSEDGKHQRYFVVCGRRP